MADLDVLAEIPNPRNPEGPPERRKVTVTLDAIPLDLKERNRLINEKLEAGEYRFAVPTVGQTTMGGVEAFGRTAEALGPSMVGIGLGVQKGFEVGRAAGPWGALTGSLAGGILGGITGRATTEASRGLRGESMAPISQQLLEGAQTGGLAAAYGYPATALIGVLNPAIPLTAQVSTSARAAGVQAARAHGIDLTAYEQSGSTLLRLGEQVSERSLAGAGTFRAFAERQAAQVVRAGERVGEQFGPPMDVMARSNRFLTALEGRMENLKGQANALFERYVQAAGPRSPVLLDNLYAEAKAIQSQQPVLESLSNPRLGKILGNIQDLQKQGFTHLPLETYRTLKTSLGDVAFPSRLEGVVTVDAPVAAAQRLYGAIMRDMETHAQATRTLPLLQEANQFQSSVIGTLDSKFYTALLNSEKNLGTLSKQLFNPRDPGMLLDAKVVTSPEGWKLLQQQYWDMLWNKPGVLTTTPAGTHGFNGLRFSEQMATDLPALRILYTPEQLSSIQEFAAAARLASRSATLKEGDAMGIFVGMGQGYLAVRAIQNAVTGDIAEAVGNAAMVGAPFIFSKALTNPTIASMLTRIFTSGVLPSRDTTLWMGRYLAQLEALRESGPSVSVPVPQGLKTVPQGLKTGPAEHE